MLFESIVLMVMGGVQAYIIRRLDKQDELLSQLELELRLAIRNMPKRKDDP